MLVVYMGWLQLVGSFKLSVSFAEYRVFYRAILQKRPVILRSLLIVATPYHECLPMHIQSEVRAQQSWGQAQRRHTHSLDLMLSHTHTHTNIV